MKRRICSIYRLLFCLTGGLAFVACTTFRVDRSQSTSSTGTSNTGTSSNGTGGGDTVCREDAVCGAAAEAAKSCEANNPAAKYCGPNNDQNCCDTRCVPGGTFLRSYDGDQFSNDTNSATVRPFYLDKYEVTVGRFRRFVEANFDPPDGMQGHPSGRMSWNGAWEGAIQTEASAFKAELNARCATTNDVHYNWTESVVSKEAEARPMNCVNWAEAYAFCLWDGGRLPTEAEWNFAAAAGDEQRVYPWSSPPSDSTISEGYAGYGCDINTCETNSNLLIPGSRLDSGDGACWGHADLAGNLYEWVLDAVVWTPDETSPNMPDTFLNPCDNCVDDRALGDVEPNHRALRGGTWWYDPNAMPPPNPSDLVKVGVQLSLPYNQVSAGIGFRCARDVPTR